MKRLPIFILLAIGGLLLYSRIQGNNHTTPPGKYEKIIQYVTQLLKEGHYSPQKIDDNFSKKIFKKYLHELDGDKTYFLTSDIDTLKKKYELKIDDELNGDPVSFCFAAGNKFLSRELDVESMVKDILSKPFDFNFDESIQLDGDKLEYSTNLNELKERWRKRLKFLTLERYVDLTSINTKNKEQKKADIKSDEILEKEAREKVQKIMDRTFERYRLKFSDDDKFNTFVNTVTTTMDPHTEFFPPIDKRYFDEEMSGTFSGIGATLLYDEGNIKISSLITGSPAWKSGQVLVGDIVTKVAQGDLEPVDLAGFVTTDAVKLIRGNIGTPVKKLH